jgi:hypothetical protein
METIITKSECVVAPVYMAICTGLDELPIAAVHHDNAIPDIEKAGLQLHLKDRNQRLYH